MKSFTIPEGKCLSGAGQSLEAIFAMEKCLGKKRLPVVLALYEELGVGGYRENKDISEAPLIFPNCVLQIGLQLPLNNEENLWQISSREYEPEIIKMAKCYKSIGSVIILRIGYEFDGKWNNYHPDAYISAFRKIVRILREQKVSNVYTMFDSYFTVTKNMLDWYPGDDVVDYFGFNTFYPDYDADWFCEVAKAHNKPVMIGESSYAINCENTTFREFIENYFRGIIKYDIKAYQYINWEWSIYPERMNWKNWQNARFTQRKEDIASYIKAMPDNLIYRDPKDQSPLGLFVECARMLPETLAIGKWKKSYDLCTKYKGFNYRVEGFECRYNNGFITAWHKINENAKIILFYPQDGNYWAGICVNGEYYHYDLNSSGTEIIAFPQATDIMMTKIYIAKK